VTVSCRDTIKLETNVLIENNNRHDCNTFEVYALMTENRPER